MRNLNIYLVLLLCLFASKIVAQDSIQKGEQTKKTFEQAWEELEIKHEQIKQEEEKVYNEEINKLKALDYIKELKAFIQSQDWSSIMGELTDLMPTEKETTKKPKAKA
jgi:hypothetical protein